MSSPLNDNKNNQLPDKRTKLAEEPPTSQEKADKGLDKRTRLVEDKSTKLEEPEEEVIIIPMKTDFKRSLIVLLNIFCFLLFLITVSLVCLWPEYLLRLGIESYLGVVVLMLEIAFLLFLGGWQYNFSLRFRVFAFINSLIVTCEAMFIYFYSC